MEERNERITYADMMAMLSSLEADVQRMRAELGELVKIVKSDEDAQQDERGSYTVEGAAKYLHVSVRTMREYGRTNLIPSVKSGKRRLYRKADLDEYLNSFTRMSNEQVERKAMKLAYS